MDFPMAWQIRMRLTPAWPAMSMSPRVERSAAKRAGITLKAQSWKLSPAGRTKQDNIVAPPRISARESLLDLGRGNENRAIASLE